MTERISAKEFNALVGLPAKKGRYGKNKRQKTVDGNFDSKGEHARYKFLCLLEREGSIQNLERQVRYKFELNGVHICDYVLDHRYNIGPFLIHEDFKGRIITPEFIIKKKMMKAFFGIDVLICTKVRAMPS